MSVSCERGYWAHICCQYSIAMLLRTIDEIAGENDFPFGMVIPNRILIYSRDREASSRCHEYRIRLISEIFLQDGIM